MPRRFWMLRQLIVSYVMIKDECALFNYHRKQFGDLEIARRAVAWRGGMVERGCGDIATYPSGGLHLYTHSSPALYPSKRL